MSAEQRFAPRHALYLWATVRRYASTQKLSVIIKDLSRTGFRIRSAADYTVGDLIFIAFDDGIEAEAWVVREHPTLPDYGCQFRAELTQHDVDRIIADARKAMSLHDAA